MMFDGGGVTSWSEFLLFSCSLEISMESAMLVPAPERIIIARQVAELDKAGPGQPTGHRCQAEGEAVFLKN